MTDIMKKLRHFLSNALHLPRPHSKASIYLETCQKNRAEGRRKS